VNATPRAPSFASGRFPGFHRGIRNPFKGGLRSKCMHVSARRKMRMWPKGGEAYSTLAT
jgi:hypothetical protein